jgi:GNAT superfamily N-acetyltransferase
MRNPVLGALDRTVVLLDGSTARLRPVTPADAAGLKELFARVTPRSRYLRFHHFVPRLTDEEARRYTAVDNPDLFGVVVTVGHDERIAGVGHYFRVGKSTAEVAFLVDDPYQGHGIATLILEELVDVAWSRGIDTFEADVLGENRQMMEVFHGAGFPLQTMLKYGTLHVTFPISRSSRLPAAVDSFASNPTTESGLRLGEKEALQCNA